jgi:hypothetical protein
MRRPSQFFLLRFVLLIYGSPSHVTGLLQGFLRLLLLALYRCLPYRLFCLNARALLFYLSVVLALRRRAN